MARYKDAIAWMVDNDDTEFLDHDASEACGTESVTAAMVADLFGKSAEEVRKDMLAYRKRSTANSS